jgi:hydrogenase maturation protease
MREMPANNVLVLGLGNTLLADDGVGVHIIRRLTADAATPAWLHAIDGGTMGFRLTTILTGAADILIIDAADLRAAPGTIRLIGAAALAAHIARTKTSSAHEAGLANLLTLLRLENIAPRNLAVLAIQPRIVDWGETLSDDVEKSIPPACKLINTTTTAWRRA